MSRGLGEVQKVLLEHVTWAASNLGSGDWLTLDPARLPGTRSIAAPSVRRAAASLRAGEWVETSLRPESIPYLPSRHRPYWDHEISRWVSAETGRILNSSTTRQTLHARFALGQPHPVVEARLTPSHRARFEALFARRARYNWETARDFKVMVAEAKFEAQFFMELRRDAVRWRDSMGPTLTPEWVYFRWESGQLYEQ